MLDRAGVRVGKVEHVNEIANTGSVARVVVGAQYLKIGPKAQGSFDCNGDHVRFRRMPFADSPLRIRAGGVEVAQHARSKALVAIEVAQDLLDDELASTIRIDWALNVSLNDGCRQGNSVRGAGRGEDHFVYACSLRGPKQRYRSGDVVVIEAARVANRLT